MMLPRRFPMSAVLTPPAVPTYTPDDLLRLPDRGKGFELVGGKLKELNVSFLSSFVAGSFYFALRAHVGPPGPGWVSPEGTSFRCFPDDPGKVRRADTAFHRLDRLTAAQATAEGHCTVVPDLVVEVISPNDLADDVNGKRVEWLEAGARLVWVVYPVQRNVHAFRSDGPAAAFGPADALTAEPVLPDFRAPVADLFRLPSAGS
jgi:Uma2 family endonuclease